MFELFREAVSALQLETTLYSQGVQAWMKLMGLTFLASILFVYSKKGSRYILAALVLNLLGLVIGKMLFPDLSRTVIGTYVHLLMWPPLLWAVWCSCKTLRVSKQPGTLFNNVYLIWLACACLLMSISLVFDFRALILSLF